MILALAACWGGPPETLGFRNGSLAPCPGTPNCVHTGLRHPEGTRGIYLKRSIGRASLLPSIRRVVESMPRTRVVTESDRYLHAEVRSKIFRFVDDLEILIMPDWELVVRSASRIGQGDMGANAARVEELRRLLEAADLLR
jgi:uncharacterized protein (DUF1499 family)